MKIRGIRLSILWIIWGIAISISGCNDNLQKRLNSSVATVQGILDNTHGPVEDYVCRKELADLKAANKSSLQQPQICCALFWYISDGKNAHLLVRWIGDNPNDVDAVRVTWERSKTTKDFSIGDDDRNMNNRGTDVLHYTDPLFKVGSEDEVFFASHEQPTVSLLKKGQIVSNSVSITWVWAGGKFLKWGEKVTTPSAASLKEP